MTVSANEEMKPAPQADLRYEATASFLKILETAGCSLAVSVYMQNRVVLISAEGGRAHITSHQFSRPMGIATSAADGELKMALATFQEVVVLADAPLLARSLPDDAGRFRHLLVPRASVFCGDIDAHDLVWVGNRLFAANTRFSCIAEIDARYSFSPVWTPPFVTQLLPDDRCHLNGLADADGRIVYATAFAQSDAPRGWSEVRFSDGILMEVPSGRVILDKLCMPHSPRVFSGQLYVLDSGTGRVLRVDPGKGLAEPFATLPGFTRGFDRAGDVLFVGLSRIRNRPGGGMPIGERHAELFCGVAAIDRQGGQMLGYLRFDESYEEVFDVKVLPNFTRGGMLNVDDERHRRALVLPGRAFWGAPIKNT